MNYIEMSEENVKENTIKLFEIIKKDRFDYDLVIFISKGAFLIGSELAEMKKVPLLEIYAQRKGSLIKRMIKPFLRCLPKSLLISLRKQEMKNPYHEKNKERNVSYSEKKYINYKKCEKILLVDDSTDSGYSIKEALNKLEELFEDSQIKTAVFNTMSKSKYKPEYTLFSDVMICGPWSNDSKYYKEFIAKYKEWKKNYDR